MDFYDTESQPTYFVNPNIFLSRNLFHRRQKQQGLPSNIDFNSLAKEILDVKELIYEITENIEIGKEKINYLK